MLMFILLKNNMNLKKIYPFYLKKMKIEKVENLAVNLDDKKESEFVIHVKNLKQASHG